MLCPSQVLIDVDTDGAVASDDLPLSSRHAMDALSLFGVNGHDRSGYAERAGAAIDQFCEARAGGQMQCTSSSIAALQDLFDEAHHAGAYARIFPPVGAHGCSHYCEFLQPTTGPADAGHGTADDQLTWAFLKAHGGLLPPRSRLPPSRAERRKVKATDGK